MLTGGRWTLDQADELITLIRQGAAHNPPSMDDEATMPRLVLRVIGGQLVALCTEDGNVFGMQTACSVSSEAGNFSTVTASFHVDGEAIRFAD